MKRNERQARRDVQGVWRVAAGVRTSRSPSAAASLTCRRLLSRLLACVRVGGRWMSRGQSAAARSTYPARHTLGGAPPARLARLPAADGRPLPQHVEQEPQLAQQADLPVAEVAEGGGAEVGDVVQRLHQRVDVTVGHVVLQPGEAGAVVRAEVELEEAEEARVVLDLHPPVHLGRGG